MFSFVRLLRGFAFPIFRFQAVPWHVDLQGVRAVVGRTKPAELMSAGCRTQRRVAT